MKKIWILGLIALVCSCATTKNVSNMADLDTAIRVSGKEINESLDRGTKIALIHFNSPSDALSDYVLEEMSIVLVKEKKLVVVERKEIDRLRNEMIFQMSGEVSDESAQKIGAMLGAQSIITGSLANMGETFRFRIKVISVKSAAIEAFPSMDIKNDSKLQHLLAQSGKGSPQQTASAQSGVQTARNNGRQSPARVTPLRWSVMDYKDKWGDSTGNYVEFDGNISGLYSNIWDSNVPATITNFRFSRKEGLVFKCRKLESFMGYNGDLYIKVESGDERKYRATVTGDGTVRVEFSQALVDYIKGSGAKIMFTSDGQECRFDFPPRFEEAYSLLENRERK